MDEGDIQTGIRMFGYSIFEIIPTIIGCHVSWALTRKNIYSSFIDDDKSAVYRRLDVRKNNVSET